ncbi:signal recognition particle-docking protein FtsY [Mesorhizobium sp. SP-1A]|uniref:signal recognition particle-docking protein FtsY n=1 Tax=Mesorhizobium sp. SP-1A TaxID=3077840 RepID=UPI0028F7355F|nr:signal recognition particle-docking protein FtsY [Mesorhizobium sp. SP-1A]
MAFGFIKKVFSFGKKEVVEERPDETAPLPPLNFEALEALKKEEAAEPVSTETPKTQEAPQVEERSRAEEATTEPVAETPPPVFETPKPAVEPVEPVAPVETGRPAEKPAAPSPEPVSPVETSRPVAEKPEPKLPEPGAEAAPTQQSEPVARTRPDEPPATAQRVAKEPAPVPGHKALDARVPEPKVQPAAEARKVEPAKEAEPPAEAPAVEPARPATAGRPPAAPTTPAAPEPAKAEPAAAEEPVKAEPVQAEAVPAAQPPPPKPAAGKVTVSKKVEQKAVPEAAAQPAQPRRSWFQRMREGLARSSKELSGNIAGVFTKRKLDEDTLQDLEDVLIRADLGVETALRVTDALAASRYGKDVSDAEVRSVMATEVEKVLKPVALPLELDLAHKPHVVLVVGVNGTGKTTTIGKLAAKLTEGGLSVMLAAGDTFRAAAIEQLKIWGERTGSPVVATKLGADAAGLAYDAFEKAKEAGSDVLIIDTAGRLQNKAELMAELEKIVRVLGKLDPEAPHTVLQTVDATTGQNALNQVEIFRNVAGVNGLVMTKLDGTARGGILVAIAAKHKLPVYFIGVGEQVDDLEPFSAGDFAKAIAGVG